MVADASGSTDDAGTVVAAVDSADGIESYVIADITDDEAWMSIHTDDAPALRSWR
jgi:hypothetical protein